MALSANCCGRDLCVSLISALLTLGCSPVISSVQTTVRFTTVEKGSRSGITEPLQVVIRSQEEWLALWAKHLSIRKSTSPPDIDFSAEMVVGLFSGQKSTGGYSVEITRVELDRTNLRVYYQEKSPPPGAMVTQVLTQPYHLVRLPRHDVLPVFQQEDG